jgi:hypothetical protein
MSLEEHQIDACTLDEDSKDRQSRNQSKFLPRWCRCACPRAAAHARDQGAPVYYPGGGGWRAPPKARVEVLKPPVKVVHGCTLGTKEARSLAKSLLRLAPDRPSCRTRRLREPP